MKNYDLGSCCVCEGTHDVDNLLQLDYKVESETAWGCFVCNLPMQGAVAAVCDLCMETYADIEPQICFLMDTAERRIPVPPKNERIPHLHDMRAHSSQREAETQ